MMLAASIPDISPDDRDDGGRAEKRLADGNTYHEITDEDELERLMRC